MNNQNELDPDEIQDEEVADNNQEVGNFEQNDNRNVAIVPEDMNKTNERIVPPSKHTEVKNPPTVKKRNTEDNNADGSKPAKKGNKKSVCQDCEGGICEPFNVDQIESIIQSSRSNGASYYKIKFRDKSRSSAWFFKCKIPKRLVDEFHIKRTMTGKAQEKTTEQTQILQQKGQPEPFGLFLKNLRK